MKLARSRNALLPPFWDGALPSENGGRKASGVREHGAEKPTGGTSPHARSESEGRAKRAKTERSAVLARKPEHGESHATGAPAAPSRLPREWMQRHRTELAAREQQARRAAIRSGRPWTLHADEQTRAILADMPGRKVNAATAADYRRTYERLRATGLTALQAAKTRGHWDKLRTACRYCMTEDARAWRAASERARKRGDLESAQRRTERAWHLASALDLQFLQPDRPTWSEKAARLRAKGQSPPSKAKRAGAPPPDALMLCLLSKQRRGLALSGRHAERLAMVGLFGLRPAEARKGVRLMVEGAGARRVLTAQIRGAKVNGQRGQALRLVGVPVKGAAAEFLAERVATEGGRWMLETTSADHRSLNRMLAPHGLSWYSMRHQTGAELKEAISTGAISPEVAAAVMGHRSSVSLASYGTRSRARGGRVYMGKAAEPVRVVPVSRSQKAGARTARACARPAASLPRAVICQQPRALKRSRGPR